MKKARAFTSTPKLTFRLEDQDFDQGAPGTILQDFEALLRLMGDQGLPVTPAHLLAMSCLETINQNLTKPLQVRLKRALQKSYPHINGLYLLLRATGLGLIDTQIKKPRIRLDPLVLESWRSLNGAERYFALLKAWWGRASEEMLGERRGSGINVLAKNILFIKSLQKTRTLTAPTPREAEMLRFYPAFYNLALLELFGLLDIQAAPPAEGQGWRPEGVRMTDWGQVLLGSFTDFLDRSLDAQTDSAFAMLGFADLIEPLDCFEQWSQVVRPSIPAWRQDLEIPASPFQPGPHVFKVALGADCWRRIAIGGEATLEELAATILGAFNFDSDHLYCFSYRDRFGRIIEIDHPGMARDSDNALADEIKVGDIPLFPGSRIDFLFDFGDEWEFVLQTERVNADLAIRKPRVLEKHGRAPEQYGGW